jgi:hypothetical protein
MAVSTVTPDPALADPEGDRRRDNPDRVLLEDLVDTISGLGDTSLVKRFEAIEMESRRLDCDLAMIGAEVVALGVYRAVGHRSARNWMRAKGFWSNEQFISRRRLGVLID